MGTRSLTCIYSNGKYQFAKYCQWDGYPEGQGVTLLRFLKQCDMEKLRDQLKHIIPFNQEKQNRELKFLGATDKEISNNMIRVEIMHLYSQLHPSLSRDLGAEVLELLYETSVPFEHYNNIEFAASLSCEWCYLVDLDSMALEIYKGMNKEPLNEDDRFYFLEDRSEDGYHPVKLIHKFDLSDLPNETEFISLLTN